MILLITIAYVVFWVYCVYRYNDSIFFKLFAIISPCSIGVLIAAALINFLGPR